jgi:hypothetical protein
METRRKLRNHLVCKALALRRMSSGVKSAAQLGKMDVDQNLKTYGVFRASACANLPKVSSVSISARP